MKTNWEMSDDISVFLKCVCTTQNEHTETDWTEKTPEAQATIVRFVLPPGEEWTLVAHDVITAYKKIGGKRLRFKINAEREFSPTAIDEMSNTLVPATFAQVFFDLCSIPVAHDIESDTILEFSLINTGSPDDHSLAIFMGSHINKQVGFPLVPDSWYTSLLPREKYVIRATVVPAVLTPGPIYWQDADVYGASYQESLITQTYDSGRPSVTPSCYITETDESVVLDLLFQASAYLPGAVDELRFHLSNLEIDNSEKITKIINSLPTAS